VINSLETSTERIAVLERALAERTSQLQAVTRELEGFSYSISHDLRSPLRHILGYLQIFAEDHGPAMDPRARECMEKVHQGAQKLSEMIEELLRLSRLGRQQMSVQPILLDTLVHEVVHGLENDASGRQIEWHIDALPTVQGDPPMIRQLFTNLVANAIKFTRPRSQAVISIGTEQADGAPAFFVRDNGVGFDQKYADKLFTIFQRLHPREDFEGRGAGLASAQRIVARHGGRMWAESEVDKGATFYFTLNAAPGGGV